MSNDSMNMTARELGLYKAMREEARANGELLFKIERLLNQIGVLQERNRVIQNELNLLKLRYEPTDRKPGHNQPVQMKIV